MLKSFVVLLGILLVVPVGDLDAQSIAQEIPALPAKIDSPAQFKVGTYEVVVEADDFYRAGQEDLDDYQTSRCYLDWYLPKGKKNFPVLVWFHGGGLRNGQKAGEHDVAIATFFAKAGIGVASVNYRMNPKAEFPAYVEDAAAAVAFVKKNVANKGGSDDQVFVSGHSAGGYLTLMVALAPKYLGQSQLKPTDLAGYLPISGQTITHSTVRSEMGIDENQPWIDEAAPSYHCKNKTSPILCIAGSNDLAGRSEENRYLVAMLKSTGQDATFAEFEGRDHGTIAHWIPKENDAVATLMLEFIQRIVRPETPLNR